MIINPIFSKCIEGINQDMIESFKIVNPEKPVFKTDDNILYYYKPEKVVPQSYIVCFDIDWTMTFSENSLFAKGPSDIHLLPHRKEYISYLFKRGYTIVFFTNQNCATLQERTKRLARMSEFIEILGIPCYVFVSTKKDSLSWKPDIGAWEKFLSLLPFSVNFQFYCGDAGGRPQDFADSDKIFAESVGMKFFVPEQVFPCTLVPKSVLTRKRQMIVFVGMPGSGKSSYYKKYLEPLDYVYANQDTLKTRAKVLKVINIALKNGQNVVVDSTNPARTEKISDSGRKTAGRDEFYHLAEKAGFRVVVLYFLRDGYGWNKLRDKKVPDIIYHTYFKNLDSPRYDGREIYEITDF